MAGFLFFFLAVLLLQGFSIWLNLSEFDEIKKMIKDLKNKKET